MFTFGLAALAVAAALVARTTLPLRTSGDSAFVEVDSCFRYGRFECCVKPASSAGRAPPLAAECD
jgi:hypothetical protein